jgi:hypothetical protein
MKHIMARQNAAKDSERSDPEESQKKDTGIGKDDSPVGDKLLFEDKPAEHKAAKKSEKKADARYDKDEDGYVHIEDKMEDDNDNRGRKDYIHIKVNKNNILWVERILYWAIIIILLILLFKDDVGGIFSGNRSDDSLSMLQTTIPPPLGSDVSALAQTTAPGVSTIASTQPTQTTARTSTTSGTCTSAKPKIEIKDIEMNSSNSKKINSIEVKITNNYNEDLKDYLLSMNWYNDDDLDEYPAFKTMERLTATTGHEPFYRPSLTIAKCGGTATIVLDSELKMRLVTSRDVVNTFDIYLYDSGEDEIAKNTYDLDEE